MILFYFYLLQPQLQKVFLLLSNPSPGRGDVLKGRRQKGKEDVPTARI